MKKRMIGFAAALAVLLGVLPLTAFAEAKPVVLSSIGDSVASGYGLVDGNNTLPMDNYYNCPEDSYPSVLGKMLNASAVYNLGVIGVTSSQYADVLKNPEAYKGISYASGEPLLSYMMITALRRSNVVTIALGGNDLYRGAYLYNDIAHLAFEFDEDKSFEELLTEAYIKAALAGEESISLPVRNPIFANLVGASLDITVEEEPTQADIIEFLTKMTDDTLFQSACKGNSDTVENEVQIAKLIHEGLEISKEEYDAIKKAYEEIDKEFSNPSEERPAQGAFSEKEMLAEGRLSLSERDGRYFIDPINPDAEIAMVGYYNPFYTDRKFTSEDYQQLYDFFVKMFGSLFEETFPDIETSPCVFGILNPANIEKLAKQGIADIHDLLSKIDPNGQIVSGSLLSGTMIGEMTGEEGLTSAFRDIPFILLNQILSGKFDIVMRDLNGKLENASNALGYTTYVDLLSLASDEDTDIHPDAAGHHTIGEIIYNAIASIIEAKQEEEIPQEEIPQEEIPQEEIPQEEIPQEEIPQEEIPQEEIPQEEKIPQQENIPQPVSIPQQDSVPAPNTGDTSSVPVLMLLLLSSAVGMAVTLKRRKTN